MEVNLLQLLQVFLVIVVGILVFWSFLREKKTSKNLDSMQNNFNKLNHQKKSSEVRMGQIAEQLAPFLDKFPYDPKKISFLGNPIDYVYFGEDKVTIIEIKSGNARLSKKQRNIKKLILEGKVEWDEIRIK
tara:strand:- start:588 stop:980 length:393 start_codon:yes stop_codon:yes gene_type:complete